MVTAMREGRLVYFVLALLLVQDTRQVPEPVIPKSCTVLASQSFRIDEDRPDTKRIQDAFDQCPAGQAVELKGPVFLAGPLQLRAGVTLVVDRGATLYGSRNPRDYDLTPGSCGIVDKRGHGCKPLISGDHVSGAGGMGVGAIDGRGGATLIGQHVSWWDLAQEAKVKNLNQSVPRLMGLSHCDNFTLYRIMLRNSANFHVAYSGGNGFTAWGVIIDAPKTARNTDGIDPGNAKNVTIKRCFIRTGDDNVAIKAGSPGPTSNMTIEDNHFYTGHGMSIGSETDGGASAIRVTNLSIDGADNGIRIKSNSSRGGPVRDVVYEDVCITDTKNPILMDSNYSYMGEARDKLPSFEGIILRNVRVLSAGMITLDGFDEAHRLGITFDNVFLDDVKSSKFAATHAVITEGPGGVNFHASGDDVRVLPSSGKAARNTCEGKFVPFPSRD
jgi:polygalacturonase